MSVPSPLPTSSDGEGWRCCCLRPAPSSLDGQRTLSNLHLQLHVLFLQPTTRAILFCAARHRPPQSFTKRSLRYDRIAFLFIYLFLKGRCAPTRWSHRSRPAATAVEEQGSSSATVSRSHAGCQTPSSRSGHGSPLTLASTSWVRRPPWFDA